MRQQQFIRLVQEICYLLKLSQPCSKTALQYFLQFKEYEGHQFDQEILIAACIYLSTKIFQQQVRLRDILNMIYVLTASYKLASNEKESNQEKLLQQQHKEKYEKQKKQQQRKQHEDMRKIQNEDQHNKYPQQQSLNLQSKQTDVKMIIHHQQQSQTKTKPTQHQQQHFITLKPIQKHSQLHQLIQPNYTLSDYNQYKSKIIQAEQTLLRILGFDFSLSQVNKNQLKQLLITIHYLHLPPTMADVILKIYNDLHYINLQCSLQGIIYFAYLIVKNMPKSTLTIKQSIPTVKQSIPTIKQSVSIIKQINHKHSEKQLKQIQRLHEFINNIHSSQQWQLLLNTPLKILQNYAEKLTNFYLNIN